MRRVFQTGHAMAPVANCCKTKYSSQVKDDMSVKEFCDYWRNRSQGIIVTFTYCFPCKLLNKFMSTLQTTDRLAFKCSVISVS